MHRLTEFEHDHDQEHDRDSGQQTPTAPQCGGPEFPSLAPHAAASSWWTTARLERLAERMTATRAEDEDEEGDNPAIPAGYTYFGQLLAHDITFSVGRGPDARNARSPRFDLDSIYGGGRRISSFLYSRDRFVIGGRTDPLRRHPAAGFSGKDRRHDPLVLYRQTDDDVPRTWAGKAVIADPRNDDNVMIAQMHLALLLAHNALVTRRGLTFDEARRTLRHAIQWLALNDYLLKVAHPDDHERILRGQLDPTGWIRSEGQALVPDGPFRLPREFVLAGFRFGHSMVRRSYALNEKVSPVGLMQRRPPKDDPLKHLGGDRPLPKDWTLDWSFFFERSRSQRTAQRARRIDRKLTHEFSFFPRRAAPKVRARGRHHLLANLTLQRGARHGLMSGRAFAELVRTRAGLVPERAAPFEKEHPLWYALLWEAELGGGEHLGRLGSRLVVDNLVGAVVHDHDSFVHAPGFDVASLGFPRDFTIADLLDSAWPNPPTR